MTTELLPPSRVEAIGGTQLRITGSRYGVATKVVIEEAKASGARNAVLGGERESQKRGGFAAVAISEHVQPLRSAQMRIRRYQSHRDITLYLIRSVYDKDRKGMREIYLGSISAWANPDSLPGALRLSNNRFLTEAELAKLKAYLEPNRPLPLEQTRALCRRIEAVTAEILERAEHLRATGVDYPRREMRAELKALSDAWSKHLKALSYAGLRGSWKCRRGEPDTESGEGSLA